MSKIKKKDDDSDSNDEGTEISGQEAFSSGEGTNEFSSGEDEDTLSYNGKSV